MSKALVNGFQTGAGTHISTGLNYIEGRLISISSLVIFFFALVRRACLHHKRVNLLRVGSNFTSVENDTMKRRVLLGFFVLFFAATAPWASTTTAV